MGTLNYTVATINNKLFSAQTVLNLSQPESITGDGTYKSPETYIQEISGLTKNFDYISGSLVYIGIEDINIIILSTITISSGTAGNTITITAGKNGTPSIDYEIVNKITNANDVKEVSTQAKFSIVTNDTLDFFIKATSNIVLEKAVWTIEKAN